MGSETSAGTSIPTESVTGSEGSEDSGSDSSTSGTIEPPDLEAGAWEFENVSDTAPMSLHGRRVVLESGQEVVAWAETELSDIGVLNIFAAAGEAGAWPADALTSADVQNTFPTMAFEGETAFLAWAGRGSDTDDHDIFFSRWQGSGWEAPRNLTDPIDPEAGEDLNPVMVRRPGGLVVAYRVGLTESEIRVTEFLPDGLPTSSELLIPESAGSCLDITGAASADGVAHFVAKCGSDLIHATDRSGDWESDTLAGIGSGVLSPDARPGSDGEVHVVYIESDEVSYLRTQKGVFGAPVNASNTANLNERMPTVGVDAWGRVIAVAQVRLDGASHLRMSVSEDGESFGDSIRITPEATADGFQSPTAVHFDESGLPSLVFLYEFDGSDPLNLDVQIARFRPS